MVRNPADSMGDVGFSLRPEDAQERGMAPHSSVLAWRIPWTEEPGGLQFLGVAKETPLSN